MCQSLSGMSECFVRSEEKHACTNIHTHKHTYTDDSSECTMTGRLSTSLMTDVHEWSHAEEVRHWLCCTLFNKLCFSCILLHLVNLVQTSAPKS